MKIKFSQILALLIMVPISAHADRSAVWTSVAVTGDKAHIYAAYNLVTELEKTDKRAHGYYEIPTMLIDSNNQASYSLQAINCNNSTYIAYPVTIDGRRNGPPEVKAFRTIPPDASIAYIADKVCKPSNWPIYSYVGEDADKKLYFAGYNQIESMEISFGAKFKGWYDVPTMSIDSNYKARFAKLIFICTDMMFNKMPVTMFGVEIKNAKSTDFTKVTSDSIAVIVAHKVCE